MHIKSTLFTFITAAILLVMNVEAIPSTPNNFIVAAANFNYLNPLQAKPEMHQPGDIQPVSYFHQHRNNRGPPRRLLFPPSNRRSRFGRNKQRHHHKRDYATTLKLLKAAMIAYKKDLNTPPPVSMMEQPPVPAPAPAPAPAPTAITPLPPLPPGAVLAANPIMPAQAPTPVLSLPVATTPEAPAIEEIAPPANLEDANPPVPDLTAGQEEEAVDMTLPPAPELGNEMTESTKPPKNADMEEDDSFDPEEDPDDVDDPPIVNGIPVNREE